MEGTVWIFNQTKAVDVDSEQPIINFQCCNLLEVCSHKGIHHVDSNDF